jgi:hypothetical protein
MPQPSIAVSEATCGGKASKRKVAPVSHRLTGRRAAKPQLAAGCAAREQVALEITPRMQEWARHQGRDWSEEKLRGDLLSKWCSFEGWLLYDSHHADESENNAPGRPDNWRATAWEIHPITNFEIRRVK